MHAHLKDVLVVVIIVDHHSKYTEDPIDSVATANALYMKLRHMFAALGLPNTTTTKLSSVMCLNSLVKQMPSNIINYSPYRPLGKGVAGQVVRTVKAGLK